MDYKTKVEYAERIAKELQGKKTSEEIKSDLKKDGIYDRDITSVMISARKILGETFQPKIREFLLEDKQIKGAPEFNILDNEMLEILISQESKNLALEERKKMTKLIKDGHSADEVLQQIDNRFLPVDKASEQISNLQQVKDQNSGGGRMLNIGGGIALMLITGMIFLASGRLFYVLPVIGIVMIGKGIFTERMEYDD